MSEKMYLHLFFFFFGILCQGISGTLSDKDTGVSSDLLLRKRRVINNAARRHPVTLIEEANYIVKIREDNRAICAGVILTHHTVITTATCIKHEVGIYTVLSGSSYDNRCNFHNVTSKKYYYGNSPHEEYEGIVLITVHPPFEFDRRTGNIRLHSGPLSPGRMVNVYGWGYMYPLQPGWESRSRLHYITLPIMNHGECENEYRHLFPITDKYLCTYCPDQYCARGDVGAPLVADNKLAGIHVWKGEYPGQRNPDVFVNLQRSDYSQWIREHTLLM